jgi:hypothetical protein
MSVILGRTVLGLRVRPRSESSGQKIGEPLPRNVLLFDHGERSFPMELQRRPWIDMESRPYVRTTMIDKFDNRAISDPSERGTNARRWSPLCQTMSINKSVHSGIGKPLKAA